MLYWLYEVCKRLWPNVPPPFFFHTVDYHLEDFTEVRDRKLFI